MNSMVNCPGCGFRGRLPDPLVGLKTIACPQCRTTVPPDHPRRVADPVEDGSYPIQVDGAPVDRTPPPSAALGVYAGDYMKEEAGRFSQYVAGRLEELHKKRLQLAEAENRLEATAMEQKQEFHRARAATAAETERAKELAAALEAKEAELAVREAELGTREAEVAAREARVARAESRAADTDRRTAELRAAIDQLEARRTALAEERETLNRRAELLDRAEMAQHRRAAELDEFDERLRLEHEEFEREREPSRSR